ncbi:MAG: adenylate/guanylate cyclase domain-containing protein [Cyanobacteria bacterium P01_A01_bin.123]
MFIATWLHQLGLEQYVEAFDSNDIDQDVLLTLTDGDLRELGVKSLGHRKKLLAAIRSLAAVPVSPRPRQDLPGENRQVTVLFADISGFVALSHQLGAEATHGLLTQYFQAVDAIIDRFGGWVDKHIGDNVMGIFGAPVAHKDDPRRAVMAAFEVRDAVTQLGQPFDQTVTVHIGIASGQVVASRTGSDVHQEYTVIGPAVNLAARLQGLATSGEIILDESTQQAVGPGLAAIAESNVSIKGLPEPIQIWRAVAFNPSQPTQEPSRLVGRQREQQCFVAMLQTCLETLQGQTLYIRGEAGIGKSLLVQRLRQYAIAHGFQVHQVEILDFGRGPGDLWQELTAGLLAISVGDSLEKRRAIADQTINAGDLDESRRLYLNALLDIPQPPRLQALYELLDNQTRQLEIVRTVAHLLTVLSQHQPCLVVMEDLHWIDDSTLTHLPWLIEAAAGCPCLFLLTSRLEGEPIDAAWLASLPLKAESLVFTLDPLTVENATTIADRYPQRASTFIESCIQRAEGNPLFLEQLLQAGEEAVSEILPGTVQSVVLTRVDGLAVADKQALQAASVLGRRFSPDALRYMLSDRQYDLTELLNQHLIEANSAGYRFAHALIREGIYGSLLKRDRRTFHRQAATWFEQQDLELWAIHLDRAGDSQAVTAYEAAAQHHLNQFRYNRALPLAERGLILAQSPASRYALTQLKAKIIRATDDVPAAIALHRQAAQIATTPLETADAWIGVAACVRLLGGYQEGLDALKQAQKQVVGLEAARALSQIHYLRGCFCYAAGDLNACLSENTQALDYAQQVNEPELIARAMSNLGDAYYARCQIHTAFNYYDRCVSMAQAQGLGQIEIANRAQLAVMHRYRHDLTTALTEIQQTIAIARQIGERRTLMYALDTQGEFLTEQGQLELAHASLTEAFELSERLGNYRYRAYIMQRQARVLIEQGDRAAARSVLEVALAICRETDMRFVSPRVLGLLARVATSDRERQQFLMEGNDVLHQGCISHNFLWYYYDAMEASLEACDWEQADHYATALANYAAVEPFPRSDFWVTRCRTLAAIGRGSREQPLGQKLQRLRTEAQTAGLRLGLVEIERSRSPLKLVDPNHIPQAKPVVAPDAPGKPDQYA